jgi:rod shape-determining protein MreD
MSNPLVRNITRFFLLILLQVLVLNHINMGGYINPYVYLLFILLLPAAMNKSLLLFLAFITGLTIDLFGNTPGLHAAASVFMAYLRPGVLRLFYQQMDFSPLDEPGPALIGLGGFFRYTLVLVFMHHLLLFMLETLSLNNFLHTLYTILLSTLATTLVMMILVMFFSKRKH